MLLLAEAGASSTSSVVIGEGSRRLSGLGTVLSVRVDNFSPGIKLWFIPKDMFGCLV